MPFFYEHKSNKPRLSIVYYIVPAASRAHGAIGMVRRAHAHTHTQHTRMSAWLTEYIKPYYIQ